MHVIRAGTLLATYSIGSNPDDAAVGPDGNIYISQVFERLRRCFQSVDWRRATEFASSPFPLNLTWSAAGDLWVGDLDNGVEEFDTSGNLINTMALTILGWRARPIR